MASRSRCSSSTAWSSGASWPSWPPRPSPAATPAPPSASASTAGWSAGWSSPLASAWPRTSSTGAGARADRRSGQGLLGGPAPEPLGHVEHEEQVHKGVESYRQPENGPRLEGQRSRQPLLGPEPPDEG